VQQAEDLQQNNRAGEAYRRHTKGNTLYRNLGNGKFLETGMAEMGRWAWSADACDFDLDGKPEIYIAAGMITGDQPSDLHEFFWDKVISQKGRAYEGGWNSINQRIREGDSWCGHDANVFYAFEQGKYVDRSAESGIAFTDDSRAFAFTDVDGDGIVDVILKSRLGPQVRVLRNERAQESGRRVPTARHEIESRCHRRGRAWAGRCRITAGSGYLSQHSKTLYFPAGPAARRWPADLTSERPRAGSLP
jgi:hypothetical protein